MLAPVLCIAPPLAALPPPLEPRERTGPPVSEAPPCPALWPLTYASDDEVIEDELEPLEGMPLNRLKPARGYYTISVLHRQFDEGPIAPGEARVGCASFGQMRRFSVVTRGPADASLFLNASRLDGFDGATR